VKKLNTSDRSIFNKPYWKALNFDSLFEKSVRSKRKRRGKNKRTS